MKMLNRKETFLTDGFARLVLVYAVQNLALSITGMIDAAVVGRYAGGEGLAAMKLALPVFSVIGLFGNVMSSGLSIQVSRNIADRQPGKAARSILWTGAFAAAVSFLFLLAGCFFPNHVSTVLAGKEEVGTIQQQTTAYLQPILIGTLPVISYYILGSVAALEGGEKYLTASSVMIIFTDILGNWLAVKTNGGMMGIAAASVAAYLAADAVICVFLFSHPSVLRTERITEWDFSCLTDVFRSGMPMAVKYLCTILCPIFINYLMLKYGTVIGLAALTIQDAVHYVPEALCRGISSAVLLLTGFFHAEQDSRMLRYEKKYVMRYSVIAGSAVAVVMSIIARPVLYMFTEEETLILSGTSALRWYLLGVPFSCVNFAVTAYLQSIKRRKEANRYIVLNRFLVPVLCTWLLGRLWGMRGIYASFAVNEIVTAAVFGMHQLVRCMNGKAGTIGAENWDKLVDEIVSEVSTVQQAAEVSEKIFRMCLSHRIDRKRAGQIALCMEELAVNGIQHGFNDGKKHHMEVRFMILNKRLILRIRDNCRFYDLTEQYQLMHPEDPTEHIGLRLVLGCADEISYSHSLQLNNVWICVKY